MRMVTLSPLIGVVTLLVGCGPDADPLTPSSNAMAPSYAAAAGCQAVQFDVSLVGGADPLAYTGTISGDLEGTVVYVFDPSPVTFHGVTINNGGTAFWTITGGDVAELESFQTTFSNKNIASDRPGSPALIFENIGTHRVVSGADRANLAYRGTFSAVGIPTGLHSFHGVICP